LSAWNCAIAVVWAASVTGSGFLGGPAWRGRSVDYWWNGSNWSLIGTMSTGSLNGPVLQLAESQHGELLAAGSFATVNGQTMFDVARFTGSWAGPGAGFLPTGVTSLHGAPLFVGGSFTTTPNGSGPAIAFWNGSTWQSRGDVPNGAVSGLHSTPDGILVQGSFTRIGTAAPDLRQEGRAPRGRSSDVAVSRRRADTLGFRPASSSPASFTTSPRDPRDQTRAGRPQPSHARSASAADSTRPARASKKKS
jgi:hypothetical protein